MNVRWGCLVLLLGGVAAADPNDFQLYKLGCPSSATCAGVGVTTPDMARINNDNFRIFANEFAVGLVSSDLAPPSSLGHSGFAVNAELPILFLNPAKAPSGAGYSNANTTADCPAGQPCFVMPTQNPFSGPLIIPSVHLRKGLPWSFEAGARVGWIDKSRMGVGTIEAKWSVNEGFAYLPDIGVRGYGTRLFNNRDMDLTAAGLDIGIGKRFAIGGMITLTPYAGWNIIWVTASANNIDFQPGRTLADSQATPAAQLNNTGVYDELGMGANAHNRFYGGLRFIGGVLQIVGEFSYTKMGTFTDSGGQVIGMPDLMAINTSIGLDF